MTSAHSPRSTVLAVLVLALCAGAALTTPVTATTQSEVTATNQPEVAVDDPSPGVATNHTVRATYDGGSGPNDLHNVTIDYWDTGANVSGVAQSDRVAVTVGETELEVDDVVAEGNDDVLRIALNDSQTAELSGDELVSVFTYGDGIDNPTSSGDHTVTISFLSSGSSFYEGYTAVSIFDAGTIAGTVTDESGSAIEGATVTVLNTTTLTSEAYVQTDAEGSYTAQVPVDTDYEVYADATGYNENETTGVAVSEGETTTLDFSLSVEVTGTIEGQVTDEDGDPVQGVTVLAYQGTSWGDQDTTDATGHYSLDLDVGTYIVEADADGYVLERAVGKDVAENQPTTVDFTLVDGGTVSGRVTNETGGDDVTNGFVMLDGPVVRYAGTNQTGHYAVDVPAGDYTATAFTNANGVSNGSEAVSVTTDQTSTADLQMIYPEVTHASVELVDGTGVDVENVSVDPTMGAGMLQVRIVDDTSTTLPGMPNELEGLGVDDATEFEINLTVEGYDPNTLLWGARNVDWHTSENETAGTDVTIRTQAVHLEAVEGQGLPIGPLLNREPGEIDWPTGSADRADIGWNRTVYFGLFDMSNVPAGVAGDFEGLTITTNAQTFSRPRLTDGGLEVYVAGPHETLDGRTHEGYYDAFIPDDQLQNWGVNDPASDLRALYKGTSSDLGVTEAADGAWIHLDISYSDGVVEISPAPSDDGSSGGGGNYVPSKPSLSIASVSDASGEYEVGEQYAVDVTVENTGFADGSTTLTLTAGTDERVSTDVTVASRSTRTVRLTDSLDEPGTYLLDVDGYDAGQIDVVATTDGDDGSDDDGSADNASADDESSADGDDGSDQRGSTADEPGDEQSDSRDGDSDETPGFGAGVAILALLAAVGLRMRERVER